VHTSTVTVAVLDPITAANWRLLDADIDVRTTRDTGPGGQHRNKTESCVVMTHLPTGLQAKAAGRCQHHNRREAREVLEARVHAHLAGQALANRAQARKAQTGSGQRGDKVRTYRSQDDTVSDQRTGKRARLRDVLAGKLELLAG
jgi:peptide chain release factor 1